MKSSRRPPSPPPQNTPTALADAYESYRAANILSEQAALATRNLVRALVANCADVDARLTALERRVRAAKSKGATR